MTSLALIGIYGVRVSDEEMGFIVDEVCGSMAEAEEEVADLALVEIQVSDAADDFDLGLLHQEGSDQAPWDEKYFWCRRSSRILKYKQDALEGFALKLLPAERHQSINAFAKIDWLNRQQDPHLRSNLNHGRPLQNVSTNATRSAPVLWASRSVIFSPERFSNSTTHPGNGDGAVIWTSTNDGRGLSAVAGKAP